MRIVLGVILALVVSAEDAVKRISGCLGETVHLPCPCSHNLDEEFAWQMDEPREIAVLKYTNNQSSFGDSFKGRVTLFLPDNSKNCSVLLANITADDQGKYRCGFYNHKRYMKTFVYLNVSANYSVCRTNDSKASVFYCEARVRHKDVVIEWRSDGQLLTDSAQTRITYNITMEESSGLYHFSSELIANVKSAPTCNITVVCDGCTPTDAPATERYVDPEETRHRYFKIIPIVLALGLSLVLWQRWKSRRQGPRENK